VTTETSGSISFVQLSCVCLDVESRVLNIYLPSYYISARKHLNNLQYTIFSQASTCLPIIQKQRLSIKFNAQKANLLSCYAMHYTFMAERLAKYL